MKKIGIVGSGFSGAIMAYFLDKEGFKVDVFEKRNHIGGNCFTYRDNKTNIIVHKYGPHIFHTDNPQVWNFVNGFTHFVPFINRVKTNHRSRIYSLPINLHTINQFFNKDFTPTEALKFIDTKTFKFSHEPTNFEEQALHFVGRELYEAFLKNYTIKQWGVDPKELPSSILKRLPLRFNYNDNYFSHRFQGIPVNGYTEIFEKLLSSNSINLFLNTSFDKKNLSLYDHIFFTGPIDSWFEYKLGRLKYRTLDFKIENHEGDFQGCAVMNYPDLSIPYTRITEHKYFSPWEQFDSTIIFKEYSRDMGVNDEPYYPFRLANDKDLLSKYLNLARIENKVSFMGRLGTYRYLDMDKVIEEALSAKDLVIEKLSKGETIPPFLVSNDILT
jgi:UDP-galactopyranose mutase